MCECVHFYVSIFFTRTSESLSSDVTEHMSEIIFRVWILYNKCCRIRVTHSDFIRKRIRLIGKVRITWANSQVEADTIIDCVFSAANAIRTSFAIVISIQYPLAKNTTCSAVDECVRLAFRERLHARAIAEHNIVNDIDDSDDHDDNDDNDAKHQHTERTQKHTSNNDGHHGERKHAAGWQRLALAAAGGVPRISAQ